MASARTGSIEVGKKSSHRPLTITFIVLIVVGVVVGLAGLILPATVSYADGSTVASREAAISATNDFAIAYNTYDATKLDDYQERVGSLLTDAYKKQFINVTDSIFTALKPKKQTSTDANVLKIAVDSIDEDSAELLVAVDATLKNTDNDKAVPRNMRWRVSVLKVDGAWKVDNFASISAMGATNIPNSDQPSTDKPSTDKPSAKPSDQAATPTPSASKK